MPDCLRLQPQFDPALHRFSLYIKKFEGIVRLNQISSAYLHGFLLGCLSASVLEYVLQGPPEQVDTYENLKKFLLLSYDSAPENINRAQRDFFNRVQGSDETVNQFVSHLRALYAIAYPQEQSRTKRDNDVALQFMEGLRSDLKKLVSLLYVGDEDVPLEVMVRKADALEQVFKQAPVTNVLAVGKPAPSVSNPPAEDIEQLVQASADVIEDRVASLFQDWYITQLPSDDDECVCGAAVPGQQEDQRAEKFKGNSQSTRRFVSNGGKPPFRDRSTRDGDKTVPLITCDYCGKLRHTWAQCYKRRIDEKRKALLQSNDKEAHTHARERNRSPEKHSLRQRTENSERKNRSLPKEQSSEEDRSPSPRRKRSPRRKHSPSSGRKRSSSPRHKRSPSSRRKRTPSPREKRSSSPAVMQCTVCGGRGHPPAWCTNLMLRSYGMRTQEMEKEGLSRTAAANQVAVAAPPASLALEAAHAPQACAVTQGAIRVREPVLPELPVLPEGLTVREPRSHLEQLLAQYGDNPPPVINMIPVRTTPVVSDVTVQKQQPVPSSYDEASAQEPPGSLDTTVDVLNRQPAQYEYDDSPTLQFDFQDIRDLVQGPSPAPDPEQVRVALRGVAACRDTHSTSALPVNRSLLPSLNSAEAEQSLSSENWIANLARVERMLDSLPTPPGFDTQTREQRNQNFTQIRALLRETQSLSWGEGPPTGPDPSVVSNPVAGVTPDLFSQQGAAVPPSTVLLSSTTVSEDPFDDALDSSNPAPSNLTDRSSQRLTPTEPRLYPTSVRLGNTVYREHRIDDDLNQICQDLEDLADDVRARVVCIRTRADNMADSHRMLLRHAARLRYPRGTPSPPPRPFRRPRHRDSPSLDSSEPDSPPAAGGALAIPTPSHSDVMDWEEADQQGTPFPSAEHSYAAAQSVTEPKSQIHSPRVEVLSAQSPGEEFFTPPSRIGGDGSPSVVEAAVSPGEVMGEIPPAPPHPPAADVLFAAKEAVEKFTPVGSAEGIFPTQSLAEAVPVVNPAAPAFLSLPQVEATLTGLVTETLSAGQSQGETQSVTVPAVEASSSSAVAGNPATAGLAARGRESASAIPRPISQSKSRNQCESGSVSVVQSVGTGKPTTGVAQQLHVTPSLEFFTSPSVNFIAQNSPILLVKVNGIMTFALMDTGASVSIISKTLLAKVMDRDYRVKLIPTETPSVVVPSGNRLHFEGTAFLTVDIDGMCYSCQAHVPTDCVYDLILGFDFQARYDLSISPKKGTVASGHYTYEHKLLKPPQIRQLLTGLGVVVHQATAVMRVGIEIPPHSARRVPLTTASGLFEPEAQFQFIPDEQFFDQNALFPVAGVLDRADPGIFVSNPTPLYQRFPAQTPVGVVSQVYSSLRDPSDLSSVASLDTYVEVEIPLSLLAATTTSSSLTLEPDSVPDRKSVV